MTVQVKQTINGQHITVSFRDDSILIDGFGPHVAFPIDYKVDDGYADRDVIRQIEIRPTAIESTSPFFTGEMQDHTSCTRETCRNWDRFHTMPDAAVRPGLHETEAERQRVIQHSE